MLPSNQQSLNHAPMDNYNAKPMVEYYSNEYSHQGSAVIASSEHVTTSKDQELMPFSDEKPKPIEDDHQTNSNRKTDHQISSMPSSTMQTQKIAESSPIVDMNSQKLDNLQLHTESLNFAVKAKRSQKQYEKGQTYYQKMHNRSIPPQ